MADFNFGGIVEEVITSEEFSLQKAREILANETVAVLGYGVQGPGQALNLRDNGIPVIVGQREGGKTYQRAIDDGFVPGETLFPIEEAARRATVVQNLLSDAGQVATWPRIKKYLNEGNALYFSHGFGITSGIKFIFPHLGKSRAFMVMMDMHGFEKISPYQNPIKIWQLF